MASTLNGSAIHYGYTPVAKDRQAVARSADPNSDPADPLSSLGRTLRPHRETAWRANCRRAMVRELRYLDLSLSSLENVNEEVVGLQPHSHQNPIIVPK